MTRKRLTAIIMAAGLCFAMFFFAFYITDAGNHCCSGDNCPICYQLTVIEGIAKAVTAAAAAAVSIFAVLYSETAEGEKTGSSEKDTLVSLKIKLSC